MGKQWSALLGALLLVLAGIGLWLGLRAPDQSRSPAPVAVEAGANVRSRALLRITAIREEESGAGSEARWLENEVRYLLTRAQVAIAKPQGPYDPEEGAALFTLKIGTGNTVSLTLENPQGEVERTIVVAPADTTRLGLIAEIASQVPQLLPRGDTGVSLVPFIGTEDTAAYEALAQVQMSAGTGGGILQTRITTRDTPVDRLEALTRRQPEFARAWSELAHLYLGIEGEDAAALASIAETAARRAIEIDARLAEAHAALGIAQQRRGEWLPADASLTQALALDPASPPALEALGCLLADAGRIRYATLIGEQALATGAGAQVTGECLTYARLAAESEAAPDPALFAAPSIARPRALAALLAGRIDEARPLLKAVATDPARFDGWFEPLARALREPLTDAAALRAITQAASDEVIDPLTEILLGVALKEPDFVFNRLLRLKSEGRLVPTRFLWIPDARYLLEHRRFASVAERLGLAAYWKARDFPDICGEGSEPKFCEPADQDSRSPLRDLPDETRVVAP